MTCFCFDFIVSNVFSKKSAENDWNDNIVQQHIQRDEGTKERVERNEAQTKNVFLWLCDLMIMGL